jgi:hypothetical protein
MKSVIYTKTTTIKQEVDTWRIAKRNDTQEFTIQSNVFHEPKIMSDEDVATVLSVFGKYEDENAEKEIITAETKEALKEAVECSIKGIEIKPAIEKPIELFVIEEKEPITAKE